MLGHIWQGRFQAFGTDVVQTLGNYSNRIIHIRAVLAPSLLAPSRRGARNGPPGLAGQRGCAQEADQALTMHACELLHLVEQRAFSLLVRRLITPLHNRYVLASLAYCHLFFAGHSPSVTLSFE